MTLEENKNGRETFVSDVISRVLMICGSLMAVVNGLIPSLGAMIYGNLTDELVIRKNCNCTLNESVATIMLTNLINLEMIEPNVGEIDVMNAKSIEVLLNETINRVVVVGLNGQQLVYKTFEKVASVRMTGTALIGGVSAGIDVRGTHVEIRRLTAKRFVEAETDISENKPLGNGTGSQVSVQVRRREERESNRSRKEIGTYDGLSPIRKRSGSKAADAGIAIGKAQSISSEIPPTPKAVILPPTCNISYTLRNITENCRLFETEVEENMRKYALYYVYAAIATLLFAYGQTVLWNIASEREVKALSENFTESVLDKDPGFYDTKIHEGVVNLEDITDPRDVISQKDLDALSGGLGGEIAYMIQSVSNVMSGFLVSFIENWKITLVMMASAPVLGIVQGVADKVQNFVMKQKDELMHRAKGMAKKSLGSIKTVASYAGEKMEKTRYSGKLEATAQLNKLKSLVLAIQKGLSTVLAFGFLGLGFWYSSTLLPGGSVTPGALMTIFMAIISGVMQMAGTGEQLEDIGDARSAISSLLGIPTSADDDPFDQAVSQLDTVLGKLDVFNVYFHYPSRPEYQLLKSINFTVEEGQTVALLGDKGCGKSALMKLLQRIYDPQNGRVKLDGQDIRFLDRRWLRRQIGIVHKKPEFFNTSIADNIAYGKADSTLKEIVRAAKDAGAHEFIMDLPKGYATILNDDGSPLTSFQKHLLALARAIIRKPRILLWEEDLSVMDSSALNVLTNYLDQARHGRTTVVSTSHVSVAHIADVIIVLHNGEIIEQGTPKELLMSGGAFRYLATLQHFESQSLHLEKLQKSEQVSETKSPVQNGKEIPESSSKEQWEETSHQVKGFTSKLRQMIQDGLNEGQAAYKMIWMQLKDLPLLLAGALGAAITGMVAPGLSFLFGEIQKFMNDPLRVAKEGPFWASMFLVFGLFIGFGGTIEKFMLTYATEKLRSRLQKMAFDTTINKNSVPQIPGVADISYSLSAAEQQFPSVSQTPGMGLPGRLGMPSADWFFSQVPSSEMTGSPSLGAFQGLTDMPTGISSVQGLTGLSSGILPSQGLASATGTPNGIFSSQGFVGLSGLPTETTLIQGLAGISGIPQAIPSVQNLQRIPGFPAGILPGAFGNELGEVVPAVVGGEVGAILSDSSVDGGLGAVVVGTVGEGLGVKVPGAVGGGIGAMLPGAVNAKIDTLAPGAVSGEIGAMVSGSVEGGLHAILPNAVGKGIEGMIPGAVNKGLEAVVPGAVSGGLEPSLSGDAERSRGVLIPGTVSGSVAAIIPGVVSGGIGGMFSGAVSGGAEAVITGAASGGLGAMVPASVATGLGAIMPGKEESGLGAIIPGAGGGGTGAVLTEAVGRGLGAMVSGKVGSDLKAMEPGRISGITGAVLSEAVGGGLKAVVPASVTTGLGAMGSVKAESDLAAILPARESGVTGAALSGAVVGGLGAIVPGAVTEDLGAIVSGEAESGHGAMVPGAVCGITGAALNEAVGGGLEAMVTGRAGSGLEAIVPTAVGGVTGTALSEAVVGGLGTMVPGAVTEGLGAIVSGEAESGLGAMVPGVVSGITGAVLNEAVGGGLGAVVPGAVTEGISAVVSGKAESRLVAMVPGAVSGVTESALSEAVVGGLGAMVPGRVTGSLGAMVSGKAESGLGAMVPGTVSGVTGAVLTEAVAGGLGAMVPGSVTGGLGAMIPGAVSGVTGAVLSETVVGGLRAMVPGAGTQGLGAMVSNKTESGLGAKIPGALSGVTGPVLSEAVGPGSVTGSLGAAVSGKAISGLGATIPGAVSGVTGAFLPEVVGGSLGAIFPGSVTGIHGGMVSGKTESGLGAVIPGVVSGGTGAVLTEAVGAGLGAMVSGMAESGLGALAPGVVGGVTGAVSSEIAGGGLGAMVPDAVTSGLGAAVSGMTDSGFGAMIAGVESGVTGALLPEVAGGGLGTKLPVMAESGLGAMMPDVISGGTGILSPEAVRGGLGAMVPGSVTGVVGALVCGKAESSLGGMIPGAVSGVTGAVSTEAVGGGFGAMMPGIGTRGVGSMVPGKSENELGAMVPGAVGGVTGAVLSEAVEGGLGTMIPGADTGGLGAIVSGKAEGLVGAVLHGKEGRGVGSVIPVAVSVGIGAISPGAMSRGTGALLSQTVGGGLGAIMPGVVNVVPGSMVSGNVGEGHRAVLPGLIGTGDGRMVPGPVSGGLGMVVPGAGGNGGAGRIVPGMVTGGIGSMVAGSVGGSGNIPNANLLLLADPQKQADHLMEQVEKDVEAALQNSIGKYLGTKVQETISSVSTLGMALYNGWKMTLVVLAGLPIIGVANRIQHNEIDATVEPEGVEALMKTSFKKLETISALGVENKFAKKYKDAIFEQYKRTLKKIIASGFAFALGQAMVFFIYAGALRFGCYLITIGDMTPIQVLGVLMTVLFGSYATASSRAPTHASENNEDSLNRLLDDQATEVKDLVGDKLNDVKGSLDFKNVEFPDPLVQGKPLLSQLNAKMSEGQTLALVPLDNETLNPLELLVERFFEPTRGALFLDGTDIRGLDLSWLRSQYAVVSHRCFLPQYSIADNISYGNKKRACAVTRREIEDAAYSAYAHEFIMELPKGYDTVPDEDQISLNESQKMRIVIARAIIRGPPIIVLDELEEESQAVNDATHILCRNRTCLILTRHRQTIEAADHIALMYRGRVIEQGTLEELQSQGRLYHLLTSLQDVDED